MSDSPLAAFAESHALGYSETAAWPQQGATMTQGSGKVEGGVCGALPGGVEGHAGALHLRPTASTCRWRSSRQRWSS